MVTLDQEARPFTTIGLLGPTGASISPDPVRTVTASLTATSTTVSTGPATTASDSQAGSSSKRSSTIGIAVGVAVGIIILAVVALLVVIVWRRRRRDTGTSQHNDEPELKSQVPIVDNTFEPQDNTYEPQVYPADLSGVGYPPRELDNRDKHLYPKILAEAPTSPRSRQELSAGVNTIPELAHARHKDA